MKDYSQFIPSSFGFITKYEIVGEEIHVYTTETKKGEPHKYPLTSDWLIWVEKRLENQYQLVIENRKVLEEYSYNKLVNQVNSGMITISTLSVLIALIIIATANPLLSIPAFSAAFLSVIGGLQITSSKNKQLKEEFDAFQTYLKERKDIEDLSCADPNITKYLSKKAEKNLQVNKQLIENGYLDTAFNIEFMDKTSLKDLKKLISRYKISKGLIEEQKFIIPESAIGYLSETTTKSIKTRTKKPTNKEK